MLSSCSTDSSATLYVSDEGNHRIVAYDSRAFHRGLGNLTDEPRPALIFCYDRTVSPPPGRGSMGMIGIAWLASILNVASAGWISTFGA